jgi:hypothetical protein
LDDHGKNQQGHANQHGQGPSHQLASASIAGSNLAYFLGKGGILLEQIALHFFQHSLFVL